MDETEAAAQGRLILVCGLPGAGKTTLSRRLAAELGAVRLCPDEWLTGLGIDLFDEAVRSRLEAVLWEHAQVLALVGQTVILEYGFWARGERDAMRLTARGLGVPIELRSLDLPFDELWRRLEQRNSSGSIVISHSLLSVYSSMFDHPDDAEIALFDPPQLPSG